MKKTFVILVAIIGISFFAQAQVNPHAIGLRFGGDRYYNDRYSTGVEFSFQKGISDRTRVELDLGFRGYKHYSNMFLSATYQWDWNIVGGLNWYIGPGAAIGFYNWNDDPKSSGLNLGIGGQIGLEFDFNVLGAPILLSLDSRPMWDFVGYYDDGFGWGAALSLRYTW